MFKIDTGAKQEALNFAALMNALDITEHRLEPLFDEFSREHFADTPMDEDDSIHAYADFFKVDETRLLQEYKSAYRAFTELRETDEIIKRGSMDYPPFLAQTEQAPRFLYIRGKKSLLYEKRTVALVGSRQASEKAKENTRRLAATLSRNGITVVSGLAMGIDVTAHTTALANGFNTIAVIGTNLNQYYPAQNKPVQEEIERKGLIVSQFPPSSKTQRWFFPLRNGVMSGLSLATVIMEAGETSGALIQADFAIKQGRQIIIPQNVLDNKNITWPQKYIAKGAAVAKAPIDVLKVLANNSLPGREMNVKAGQLTLEDYLNERKVTDFDPMTMVWAEPVSVDKP